MQDKQLTESTELNRNSNANLCVPASNRTLSHYNFCLSDMGAVYLCLVLTVQLLRPAYNVAHNTGEH